MDMKPWLTDIHHILHKGLSFQRIAINGKMREINIGPKTRSLVVGSFKYETQNPDVNDEWATLVRKDHCTITQIFDLRDPDKQHPFGVIVDNIVFKRHVGINAPVEMIGELIPIEALKAKAE